MAFPPVIAGAAAARGVSAMSARSSVSSAVARGLGARHAAQQ